MSTKTKPTVITTVSGATKTLPAQMDPTRVVGLDPEGRIVVNDFDAFNSDRTDAFVFGLTLCCNASDKGTDTGVACRGCYSQDEVGNYIYRNADGKFPGLDPLPAFAEHAAPAPSLPDGVRVQTISMPQVAKPKVGDSVEFNVSYLRPGKDDHLKGVCRVTKVNPRSIDVETSTGQSVRCDGYMLVIVDKPFTKSDVVLPLLGQPVTMTGRAQAGKVYVVVAIKSGKYNVAILGGNDNRYYRSIDPAHLTPATTEQVVAFLTGGK